MRERKLKIYSLFAIVFGVVGGACIVAFLVLFGVAQWHLFAIRPFWLAFLLMLLSGLCLMTCCAFSYLHLVVRAQMSRIAVCSQCGKECSVDDVFCPSCGAKRVQEE